MNGLDALTRSRLLPFVRVRLGGVEPPALYLPAPLLTKEGGSSERWGPQGSEAVAGPGCSRGPAAAPPQVALDDYLPLPLLHIRQVDALRQT